MEVVLRSCRLRLTVPARIVAAAATLPRLRRRLLEAVCADAQVGVTSGLESEYRTRVARRHGLPPGRRQVAEDTGTGRWLYRDIVYDEQSVIVELDGRLGHEAESEVLRDQFRDTAATLTRRATLRFGRLGVGGDACAPAGRRARWAGSEARP